MKVRQGLLAQYVFMMRTVNSKFIRTHPACHISEMFIADMTEA